MPAITLPQFIDKWRRSTLTEKAAAQSHFNDLCEVLGQPKPTDADPTGETYTFERGASKTSGGDGYADVWKRDHFAWEYKGKKKDLKAAYKQLLDYREALDNPPLLVVSDLDRFEVHTNFTGTTKRVYAFDLADLGSATPTATCPLPPLEVLRAVFADPEKLRPRQTPAQVTEQAAAEFARLADSLRLRGHHPERAAHFLVRLLFCLFAEDIGLLPPRLFSLLVERTQDRPAEFSRRLVILFGQMATGGSFGTEDIAHFDGGLFADEEVLDLSADDLRVLRRAAALDWSTVEPAIFGTLFERSLDPSKRAQIGAHYTSRADILLVVEPVLMAPLRRRWADVQKQANDLIAKRDAASGRARDRHQQALQQLLTEFAAELARVRILDPACGSGNFLYVALKRLLDLELEVISFALARAVTPPFIQVGPEQLFGIEVNAYAYELAQVVVWIGFIQWLHDNGFGIPSSPILRPLHNIQHRDAILAKDDSGNLGEPAWPEADVIMGNPPFLGNRKMRLSLGDEYVDDLRRLYAGRVPDGAEFVCYWFEKARSNMEARPPLRVGLLATQGIRGGANRTVLDNIKQTGHVFWAESDRNWYLDGATVHVSMVGFSGIPVSPVVLNGTEVSAINADLTSGVDVTRAPRLRENAGLAFMATVKDGPFELDEPTATAMLGAVGNPNGRPNSDVIRPWANASLVTQRLPRMWVIDFGVDTPEGEAAQYEAPFEYVKKHVYPIRSRNRKAPYRNRWWLFAETCPGMRNAIQAKTRYIATPSVGKHRVFVWMSADMVPDHALIVVARDDDFFFGVLQSWLHEVWARRKGTQLREAESGFRYTPTTTLETFPFPWPPGTEPNGDPRVVAIAEAARDLVQKRDQWLNPPDATAQQVQARTLTNLYNQRPTWLVDAHRRLDEAVLDAYGWPRDLSDQEILERLLALNLSRPAA